MSYSRKPNGTSVTRYIFKKYLIVLINANCKIHRHRTAFHRPRTKSFRKHRRHEGNGNSALKARKGQSALPSHSNTTTLFLLKHNEHKHVYPHLCFSAQNVFPQLSIPRLTSSLNVSMSVKPSLTILFNEQPPSSTQPLTTQQYRARGCGGFLGPCNLPVLQFPSPERGLTATCRRLRITGGGCVCVYEACLEQCLDLVVSIKCWL